MKICFLVLYYYLTLVHFQILLYTLFGLHLFCMWFLHLILCYTFIYYYYIYFGVWVFFIRALLLLVDAVLFLFLHWSLLFFLFLIKLFPSSLSLIHIYIFTHTWFKLKWMKCFHRNYFFAVSYTHLLMKRTVCGINEIKCTTDTSFWPYVTATTVFPLYWPYLVFRFPKNDEI